MIRKPIVYFFFFLLILLFVFRSLISGFSTNLVDWYDYPLVVWIVNSNVNKLISLDLINLFNTNILYPNPNNLLLTETFVTQSILAIPVRLITQNPILIFNVIFLATYILNYLSSYLFWKHIFKKDWIAFLGAILVIFSPIYHAEYSHFQMQSYWPAFFCLYFLFKSEGRARNLILSGFFIAVQFLASVYISVFLIAAVCLYFLSNIISGSNLLMQIKSLVIVFFTFLFLSSPIIVSYIQVQSYYNVQRDYGEFVLYSAHISDYLFSGGIKSIIYSLNIFDKWNSFNKHTIGEAALFPGFVVTFCALMAIGIKKVKKKIELSVDFDRNSSFFLFLIIVGFLFSLGPRINFNGYYAQIPLPYHFLLKYVPLFDVIRAPSRWAMLFYIGLIFFTLKYLSKRVAKPLIALFVALIIILEYLPVSLKTHAEEYIKPKDEILKEVCASDPKVVLEVPVTHFDAGENILEGLNYITRTVLASTYHKCNLVNGYTSYDLPSVATLKNSLYEASTEGDVAKVVSLLKSSQAEVLVVNETLLKKEVKGDFIKIVNELEKAKYLSYYEDGVYEIRIPGE